MTGHSKIWHMARPNHALQEIFREQLGISEIVAQLLINRGITNIEDARVFLQADMQNLYDPYLFKDMTKAVERILQAIAIDEKLLIYGDYDVDGITSTSVLFKYLTGLGARVDYYIPDRSDEGYGLNKAALKWAADEGFNLIITVDCGISAVEEVDYATRLGLDIIITDHHEAPEILPAALAIIDPKQPACTYPFKELCGVGVAWKLGQALWLKRGIAGQGEEAFLDLVALGTIADIVPLQGENRILVKHGLRVMQKTQNVGLQALLEVAGLAGKEINSHHIGYMIAPRLNATGRIGSARVGVRLLLSDNYEEASAIANTLKKENEKRQLIEAEILQEAELLLANNYQSPKDRVIVLASENWHPGVIGIVASRLVDKYHRPTVMICLEGEEGKGSARSIPGFNLYEALNHCGEYLLKFGGHKQAAGLSMRADLIPLFRSAINKYAGDNLEDEHLMPKVNLDAEIGLHQITYELIKELELISPFGHMNPGPLLACRQALVTECRGVGNSGNHLKMTVASQNKKLDAIGFQLGIWADKLKTNDNLDLAFVPEVNLWQGRTTIQLNLRDIKYPHMADNPYQKTKATEKTFIDRLFDEAAQFLFDDYYRNISNKEEFYTKVVGVTFDNRQEIISNLQEGEELKLAREPSNQYDINAIRVETADGEQVGYLNASMAKYLSPLLDSGQQYQMMVTNITGGGDRNYGLNVILQKVGGVEREELLARMAEIKQKLAQIDDRALLEEIRSALLGSYPYRSKQMEAISALLEKRNLLAIFGTGRGKSAVFQTIAAYNAIRFKQMTIIIYPLRALVNDQFEAMSEKFKSLGLSVLRANGSISTLERAQLFNALETKGVDILLTTPEFIEFHLERFKKDLARIGLFVVDESHHISLATNNHRPAYKRLGKLQDELGQPITLAVTATAGDDVAAEIMHTLKIKQVIIDPHVRDNLNLIDKRDCADKNEYIKQIVAQEDKTIIYANSRIKTIEIAAYLRETLPHLSERIIFYNAGMSPEQRNQVERMFREGQVKTVVSTSAFGEGIDIPDIKHVILYHLNFNFTEFNQQSGRAGRNGARAQIHLIFGRRDVGMNQFILDITAPGRDMLGKLYLLLKQLALTKNPLDHTNSQLADMLKENSVKEANERTVSAALGIFNELKLIERERDGRNRNIYFAPPPGDRIALEDSLRFSEGLEEKRAFEEFWQYLFDSTGDTLLNIINRPIYPQKYYQKEEAQ